MVTITTPAFQGSGVVIDRAGIVVTSLHVLRGQQQASIRFANGDTYDEVLVVGVDEPRDLLLLKIPAVGLSIAMPGDSETAKVGDKVVVIGSPRGLDSTVSDGIVSAVRDSGTGYRVFQTNAAVSPGSSGGGMFNESGELIGIVSAKVPDGENINFAVPVNYMRRLLSLQERMTLDELAERFPAASPPPATDVPSPRAPGHLPAGPARLASLVGQSTHHFEKADDGSWSVAFKGAHAERLVVTVSTFADLVVASSLISNGYKLTTSDEAMQLLKANYASDLVKASVTADGSLLALNETELRLLDVEGLDRVVNAVAVLADDVVGLIVSARASWSASAGPPIPSVEGR
jgi:hypothetical protein